MRDVIHSYVWHTSYAWRDSVICVVSTMSHVDTEPHAHMICNTILLVPPIHMRDMTHSYVWHASYAWRDSFICVTWLSYMCYVNDESCGQWATSTWFVTLSPCYQCIRVTWCMCVMMSWFICVTWLSHVWDMTHSYVCHDVMIHMCDVTYSCVRHDSFICVTWLNVMFHMRDVTHACPMGWLQRVGSWKL